MPTVSVLGNVETLARIGHFAILIKQVILNLLVLSDNDGVTIAVLYLYEDSDRGSIL